MKLDLSPSIKVFQGEASGQGGARFVAWRAEVDLKDKSLKVLSHLSYDRSGREGASSMAKKNKSVLAVNGGYFDMQSSPAKTYSLVLQNGKVLSPNINRITRGARQYFVARSAFGITRDGKLKINWIVHQDGKVLALDQPYSKLLERGETPRFDAPEWDAFNAIGGGPRLVENGQENITYDDEVFFGSGFPNDENYSRCALGFTRDNKLIFVVTDALEPEISTGLTLRGLTKVLLDAGCIEAMNLDGGGSETLVVNGKVINSPSDGKERPVTSIVGIVKS
jgi:exopolysaccharide biosynthesis protein